MEPNLLEIIFNETYYLSKVGTISNAFDHYLDYGIKNCIDPSLEFETHSSKRKALGQTCLYNDWMSSSALIEKSFYLNIFMKGESHKQNDPLRLKKVKDYFNKFGKSNLEFTEQFIRSFEKNKVDDIFVLLINSIDYVKGSQLQEETLSAFEKIILSSKFVNANSRILIKLLDYLEVYDYNVDREEFVSSIVSKTKFSDDTISRVLKFYNDASIKGRTFSSKVYQNFEDVVDNAKDKTSVLEILAFGANLTDYLPNKKLLELFMESLGLAKDSSLFVKAICKVLVSLFKNANQEEIEFIASKLDILLKDGHSLSKDLVQNIFDYYTNNQEIFSDIIIRIIEEFYEQNAEIIQDFSNKNLLKLIDNNLSNEKNLKYLIHIALRIFNVKLSLPSEIANILIKLANIDNYEIKKLTLRLFFKIKGDHNLDENEFFKALFNHDKYFIPESLADFIQYTEEKNQEKDNLNSEEKITLENNIREFAETIKDKDLKYIIIDGIDQLEDVFEFLEEFNYSDSVLIKFDKKSLNLQQSTNINETEKKLLELIPEFRYNNYVYIENVATQSLKVKIFIENEPIYLPTEFEDTKREENEQIIATLLLDIFPESLVKNKDSIKYEENNVIDIEDLEQIKKIIANIGQDYVFRFKSSGLENYIQINPANLDEIKIHSKLIPDHFSFEKQIKEILYKELKFALSTKDFNSFYQYERDEFHQLEANLSPNSLYQLMTNYVNNKTILEIFNRIIAENDRDILNLIEFIIEKKIDRNFIANIIENEITIEKAYSKIIAFLLKKKLYYSTNFPAYENYIESFIDSMFSNGWQIYHLARIIRLINDKNAEHILYSLEKIYNNKLTPYLLNKDGFTIFEILLNAQSENWIGEIWKIAAQNQFWIPYTVNELVAKIESLNQENPEILELISSGYYRDKINEIHNARNKLHHKIKICYDQLPEQKNNNTLYVYFSDNEIKIATQEYTYSFDAENNERIKNILLYQQPVHLDDLKSIYNFMLKHQYANIDDWQSEDFAKWFSSLDYPSDKNIAHVLAVLDYGLHKTIFKGKYFLRNLQFIALLNHFKASKGLIQEVATSDGKTAIISCILMLELLKKRKPDSITSSQELAIRDTQDTKIFFDLFNVTSGSVSFEKNKIVGFENDIVRGDMINFGGSFLRDQNDGSKNGRLFSSVVIDEADYIMLDSLKTVIKINSVTPGFSYFQQIYTYLKAFFPFVVYGIPSCDLELKNFNSKDCDQELRESLEDFIHQNFLDDKKANSEKSVLIFSAHKDFAKDQAKNWAESLIIAEMAYEEDRDYILHNMRPISKLEPYKSIAPVSIPTGSINNRQVWPNGIQQFLGLKHNIAFFPENLVSLFASYYSYLKYYGLNIYGLTGTTGDSFQREFVKRHFDINYAILPTFKEKRFIQYPEIITNDYREFLDQLKRAIITTVLREKRSCLVLTETIKEVRILKNFLSEIEDLNILTYKHGTEEERELIEGKRSKKSTVIIATNIAGRGSNILPDREVAENGGMHVIFTFFPENLKVELQGVYRAARAGDMGSAQLIFKRKIEHKNLEINELYKERDQTEKEQLIDFETCSLQSSFPFDKNSERTRNLMLNLVSPTGYHIDLSLREEPLVVEPNKIYLSSDKEKIYLHLPNPISDEKKISINYELELLDKKIYKSVHTILNDKKVTNFYNLESVNLIHFIAANYSSYLPKNDTYNYINKFYSKTLDLCSKEIKFCFIDDLFTEARQKYITEYLNKTHVYSLTNNETQIFKYALWQEYLAVFHKNPELSQLRSNLDMFFYYNQIPFNNFTNYCNIERPEEARAKFAELNQNLEKNYNILEQKTIDTFSKEEFFNNPNFIQHKAFQYHDIHFAKISKEPGLFIFTVSPYYMNKAISLMNLSINQEPNLAWSQHNNMVLIRTQKANHADNIAELTKINVEIWNQIKVDNVKNAYDSLRLLIDEKNRYQSSFIALANSGMLNYTSQLFYQFSYNNAYFDMAIDNANKTSIAFNNALKDPEKGMKVANTYMSFELAQKANQTDIFEKSLKLVNASTSLIDVVLSQANSSLIYDSFSRLDAMHGFVFTDYESFELKEEDDSFEKVFVGICGIVQIVAGFTILATFGGSAALFANSLGLSTILSGFSDIVMVADSIINGYSINLDDYFKSKAVTYAVAIVTAGIMKGLNLNVLPSDAFAGGVLNKAVTFKFALAMQAVSMGIGYAANYAAKEYADSNRGDANADSTSMSNEIINDYSDQLFAIYAADELERDVDYLINLQNAASSARNECDKRFNDPASTIFKSSASTVASHVGAGAGGIWGAAAGALAGAAVGATFGAFKYYEYAGEFRDNYSPYLNSAFNSAKTYLKEASASEVMLSRNLNLQYSQTVTTTIIEQMQKDNFIVDHQVNFEKCKNATNYDAKNYEVNIKYVAEQCNIIYTGFNDYKTTLKQTIKQEIKNGMTGTLSSDIASPVFNSFGHFTYNTIKNKYEEYKKTRAEKERIEEEKKRTEAKKRFDENLRLLGDDDYWKFSKTVADEGDSKSSANSKTKKEQSWRTSSARSSDSVAKAYADGVKDIDKLSLNDAGKATAKLQLDKALKEFKNLPPQTQEKILHALQNKDKMSDITAADVGKELLKVIPFYVSNAEAVVPAVWAANEGIAVCMANPACSGVVLATFSLVYRYTLQDKVADGFDDSFAKKTHTKSEQKPGLRDSGGGSASAASGMPDPGDWNKDNRNKQEPRKEWEVKQYDKSVLHKKFGRFYRDPNTLSDKGNRLWWSKDTAKHGETTWKLFEEGADGLTRYRAVDKFGNYMNRHQGEIGEFIPWKELRGITFKGK